MILNTKTKLKDFKGEALKNSDKEDVTVGLVITNVLSGKVENPHRAYQLAKKIATEDKADLKIEDVSYIIKELKKNGESEFGFGALIIGQTIDVLEGSEETESKKDGGKEAKK